MTVETHLCAPGASVWPMPGGGRMDDVGILRLSGLEVPWVAVPEEGRAAVLDAADDEPLVDALLTWPTALQRALLHPASSVPTTLVTPRAGARALDLATGWSMLGSSLRSFGVHVVSADWVYERLRFAVLMGTAGDHAVHVPTAGVLPWPDRSFDHVFLDVTQVPQRHRQHVLGEVARVLSVDGTAVIGTANPLLGAERSTSAGSRVGRVRRPWAEPALRTAGLCSRRLVVPYPRRREWRWLVPDALLDQHLRRTENGVSPRRRVVRVAAHGRLARWAMPEYFVLAQRRGAREAPTLPETLLPGRPATTQALSDARVAVSDGVEFLKVPLSTEQQAALTQEAANTVLARTTAFAPFVMRDTTVRWLGDVPYTSTPALALRGGVAQHQVLRDALARVDASRTAPLSSTVFWDRLTSPRGAADAAEANAAELRERALTLGSRHIPVGPTHGDLHAGNVLLPEGGTPVLVDWNRFEEHNPLLLDAVYAAMEAHRATTDGTVAAGLREFATGGVTGVLTDRAYRVLGELSLLEAVVLVLLDRVVSYSLPRRRHKPWTLATWRSASAAVTDLTHPRVVHDQARRPA